MRLVCLGANGHSRWCFYCEISNYAYRMPRSFPSTALRNILKIPSTSMMLY